MTVMDQLARSVILDATVTNVHKPEQENILFGLRNNPRTTTTEEPILGIVGRLVVNLDMSETAFVHMDERR